MEKSKNIPSSLVVWQISKTQRKTALLLKGTFGISLNQQSFNNKMSRASLSVAFFFQCMYVLDVRNIAFDINSIDIKKKELRICY